jgi:hypothetical protein
MTLNHQTWFFHLSFITGTLETLYPIRGKGKFQGAVTRISDIMDHFVACGLYSAKHNFRKT